MSDFLLDSTLDAEQREHAQLIRFNGQTMLRVVNDVLDMSKVESGHAEVEHVEFNMREMIGHVARQHALLVDQKVARTGAALSLESVVDARVPVCIVGDPLRLNQVLANLLGNAVKFTAAGTVTLAVGLVPLAGRGSRSTSVEDAASTSSRGAGDSSGAPDRNGESRTAKRRESAQSRRGRLRKSESSVSALEAMAGITTDEPAAAETRAVEGTTLSRDLAVSFSVSDTGIGMSEDELDHIFDSYRQAASHTAREFGGTGLGLGIARKLAHAMGGELQVVSEAGAGTTFSFAIPLVEACATAGSVSPFDGASGESTAASGTASGTSPHDELADERHSSARVARVDVTQALASTEADPGQIVHPPSPTQVAPEPASTPVAGGEAAGAGGAPASAVADDTATGTSLDSEPSGAVPVVLVVEDSRVNQRILTRWLAKQERFKCNVVVAADGREGVESWRRHRSVLSCVLMDVTMPVMVRLSERPERCARALRAL